MEEQRWIRTAGLCGTHGAEHTVTYGVAVTYPGGSWSWPDVDTDAALVDRLVARLNEVQPQPCHFADLVLDYVEECACPNL